MPAAQSEPLADAVRAAAARLGFARTGFTGPERFDEDAERLKQWLERGCHGAMAYLEGPADRADPRVLLPGVRTVVACGLPHSPPVSVSGADGALLGTVAAYALGDDYQLGLRRRLSALAGECSRLAGRPVRSRTCAGSAPLLERAAAVRAGVGLAGHNTMTIVPGLGSRVLLGVLLIDLEIPADPPLQQTCEGCQACLRACPTGALVAPHLLDARRCISYLTIELTRAIPPDLRPLMGQRVFGCDACQQVCPFNAAAALAECPPDLAPRESASAPNLIDLLEMRAGSYRRLVRRSALSRASRNRLARNAAVALGNAGDQRAVGPLCDAALNHPSALVRGHAAWALGRLGGEVARAALQRALPADPDDEVRQEITAALDAGRGRPAGA